MKKENSLQHLIAICKSHKKKTEQQQNLPSVQQKNNNKKKKIKITRLL